MTRDQLEELAKWLEDFANTPYRKPLEQKQLREAAAFIRYLLAQEPVGVIGQESFDSYVLVGTHGPYKQPPIRKTPMMFKDLPVSTTLYAAPVPAVDPDWRAEAMRLHDAAVASAISYSQGIEARPDVARAALAAHLDKLGGK